MLAVDTKLCTGCERCVKDCPTQDIFMDSGVAKIKNEFCIACHHCVAICPVHAVNNPTLPLNEIIPNRSIPIDADDYLDHMKLRRSIRKYKPQKVEREKINKIIEVGRYSPTGSNLQDTRMIVVENRINELKEIVLRALYEGSQNNTSDFPLPKKYQKMFASMYLELQKNENYDPLFYHAPVALLTMNERPIDHNLAPAHMESMANFLGLGVCYIGFVVIADRFSTNIKEFLNINQDISNCMILGYPDIYYPRSVYRKPAQVTYM